MAARLHLDMTLAEVNALHPPGAPDHTFGSQQLESMSHSQSEESIWSSPEAAHQFSAAWYCAALFLGHTKVKEYIETESEKFLKITVKHNGSTTNPILDLLTIKARQKIENSPEARAVVKLVMVDVFKNATKWVEALDASQKSGGNSDDTKDEYELAAAMWKQTSTLQRYFNSSIAKNLPLRIGTLTMCPGLQTVRPRYELSVDVCKAEPVQGRAPDVELTSPTKPASIDETIANTPTIKQMLLDLAELKRDKEEKESDEFSAQKDKVLFAVDVVGESSDSNNDMSVEQRLSELENKSGSYDEVKTEQRLSDLENKFEFYDDLNIKPRLTSLQWHITNPKGAFINVMRRLGMDVSPASLPTCAGTLTEKAQSQEWKEKEKKRKRAEELGEHSEGGRSNPKR